MIDGMAGVIRVLVIDDHPIVRQGLISLLTDQPDLEVVTEGSNGEQAITLFRQHCPDVTLMDLRLPGMSGVQAISAIRKEFPNSCFVVVTTYDGDEDIYRAFEAGAKAYVLKDMFCDEILETIRAVHAGRRRIPAAIAQRLTDRMPHSDLSPRELDVLRLIVKGDSNKGIGVALGITEGTVKTHVVSILAKLGVSARTAAATVALQRGIVHL